MLNETDLEEFYEMLEKKQQEDREKKEPLLEKQIRLIQELIKVQYEIMGMKR